MNNMVGNIKVPELSGTKLDLFKTAVNLFAKKGFANVSMRDISTTMNLNVASIYNHFSSKDAFLTEAYDYYRYNYYANLPPLKRLLGLVSKIAPQDIWRKIQPVYEPELLDTMTKIALIAIDERRHSASAYDLVHEVFVDTPKIYLRTLLNAMADQGIIEPVDVDNFAKIHAAFNLYASVRIGGDYTMSVDDWHAGHDYIFRFIRLKNPQITDTKIKQTNACFSRKKPLY